MILRFMKSAFVTILNFGKQLVMQIVKCMSLNNQTCYLDQFINSNLA